MEPNVLLDALLEEAGMSRAGLSARINELCGGGTRATHYDHTSVGRWISGQRPRGRVPEIICDILARQLGRPITPHDVGMGGPVVEQLTPLTDFVARATALWRRDQHRAGLGRTTMITGMQAVEPVWEWANPPADGDVSRLAGPRVEARDVLVLRAARERYEAMYRRVGGVATMARVVGFLAEHTAPLLRGSYGDQTGRTLYRATGGLVAIAGICAYDSDAHGLAQRYFHQALRLAKASGEPCFGGYVVALLVNQALFLNSHRHAIAFAEAALRTAGPCLSPALTADLHAMQAEAFAHTGAGADARRCAGLAERVAGRIRPEEEPAEAGYVQPGLIETRLAEAFLVLGEDGTAREFAAEAARHPAHDRGRVHRLATLAAADLALGEAERAADSVVRMVATASGMESYRLRYRFVQIRDRLIETGGRAAHEAVAAIDRALSVPL